MGLGVGHTTDFLLSLLFSFISAAFCMGALFRFLRSMRGGKELPCGKVPRPVPILLKGAGMDDCVGTILWTDKKCFRIINILPRKESCGYMRHGYFQKRLLVRRVFCSLVLPYYSDNMLMAN